MGKPIPSVQSPRAADEFDPENWPDWVLTPPGGFLPDNMQRTREKFHDWQTRRDDWFHHRGMRVDLRACYRERERRMEYNG